MLFLHYSILFLLLLLIEAKLRNLGNLHLMARKFGKVGNSKAVVRKTSLREVLLSQRRIVFATLEEM